MVDSVTLMQAQEGQDWKITLPHLAEQMYDLSLFHRFSNRLSPWLGIWNVRDYDVMLRLVFGQGYIPFITY
jgi:hypothetical protein